MMPSGHDRATRRFGLPLALCFVSLFVGCAPQFTESLQPWLGRADTELLAAYDAAPSAYTLDERTKILTWSASSFKAVDPLSDKSKMISHSQVLTSYSRRCAVSFTVVDGIVQKWDWRGDNRRLCPVPRPPDS